MSISSINTNIAALAAQANIARASDNAAASISRLSSGNRITKSSDDVAGLAVGTSLATQVTALKSALSNAAQGTSLLQVADGALAQINSILQQQKALAIQAGSGSLSDTDRSFLDQQFQGLTQQIDQISSSTNFNGVTLLNGGTGTTTTLANTDDLAALFDPSAVVGDASTVAIQAFDKTDGTSLDAATGAGSVQLVAGDNATELSDSDFANVNSAVYGQFNNFQISNVVYGATGVGSATISAQLNGVTFTGNIVGGATNVNLKNGNTNLLLSMSAVTLTDAGTVQNAQAQLGSDFEDTIIQRTSTVDGVDFAGTVLKGAVGSGGESIAMTRLASTNATIGNFAYAGNAGGTDANTLSVQVNGQTFLATSVPDEIVDGNDNIVFTSQSGDGQAVVINLSGMTGDIQDIHNNADDRTSFINALNQGFSHAGSGLNFTIGTGGASNVNVTLGSASSNSLFSGQSLSVADAASANAASTAIDQAINSLSGIQATVGSYESRFNFASANLQSSVQNEDAARGSLLDTDVSSESTAYATAQVQLQAGIAVLAQANLLPQNLLKLIQ